MRSAGASDPLTVMLSYSRVSLPRRGRDSGFHQLTGESLSLSGFRWARLGRRRRFDTGLQMPPRIVALASVCAPENNLTPGSSLGGAVKIQVVGVLRLKRGQVDRRAPAFRADRVKLHGAGQDGW